MLSVSRVFLLEKGHGLSSLSQICFNKAGCKGNFCEVNAGKVNTSEPNPISCLKSKIVPEEVPGGLQPTKELGHEEWGSRTCLWPHPYSQA